MQTAAGTAEARARATVKAETNAGILRSAQNDSLGRTGEWGVAVWSSLKAGGLTYNRDFPKKTLGARYREQ